MIPEPQPDDPDDPSYDENAGELPTSCPTAGFRARSSTATTRCTEAGKRLRMTS